MTLPATRHARRRVLTPHLISILDLNALGLPYAEIAVRLGVTWAAVRAAIADAAALCDVPIGAHPRICLALWWHSELFQLGLRAKGLRLDREVN